jgi:hypothetical protein
VAPDPRDRRGKPVFLTGSRRAARDADEAPEEA